jgi:hypothetical protein
VVGEEGGLRVFDLGGRVSVVVLVRDVSERFGRKVRTWIG